MSNLPPRLPRRALRAALAAGALCFSFSGLLAARGRQSPSQQPSAQKSTVTAAQTLRTPRQQAQNTAALDGIVRASGFSNLTVPVPGAVLTLHNLQSGETFSGMASGEGVFRIFPITPGHYELRISAHDYGPFVIRDLAFQPNEVVTLEISLITSAAI